jgi:hypothetical protein
MRRLVEVGTKQVFSEMIWTRIKYILQMLHCTYYKGKGKVPALFLTEHHAMKAYWGSGGIAPPIL